MRVCSDVNELFKNYQNGCQMDELKAEQTFQARGKIVENRNQNFFMCLKNLLFKFVP